MGTITEEAALSNTASSIGSVISGSMRLPGKKWHKKDEGDTSSVVNRKKSLSELAPPSLRSRSIQILVDFQKSTERSVNLRPMALCLNEANDFLPSMSIKSISSFFSKRIE